MPTLLVLLLSQVGQDVIAIEPAPHGAAIRQGSMRWLLTENDWPEAFALVPELRAEAQQVRDRMHLVRVGRELTRVGLGVVAIGLEVALSAVPFAVLTAAELGVFLTVTLGFGFAGAILAGLGLVLALVGLPMRLLDAATPVAGLVRRHNEVVGPAIWRF